MVTPIGPSAGVPGDGADDAPWLAGACDVLQATRGVLCALTADGRALEPRWACGYPEGYLSRWARMDLSMRAPVTDSARERRVVAVRSLDELAQTYPGMVLHTLGDMRGMLSAPVSSPGGGLVGALALMFRSAAELDVAVARLPVALERLGQRLVAPGSSTALPRQGMPVRSPAAVGQWDEPQTLHRLARRLVSALSAEDVVDLLAESVGPILGAQAARLTVVGPWGEQRVVTRTGTSLHPRATGGGAVTPSAAVIASGRPLWFRDRAEVFASFPDADPAMWAGGGSAVVPMAGTEGLVGTMVVGWAEPQVFNAWQREAVERVADLCAAALLRARARSEHEAARSAAERQASRLHALTDLAADLATCQTPDEVGEVLVGSARRVVGADAASLVRHGDSWGSHLLAWSADRPSEDTGLHGDQLDELAMVKEHRSTGQPIFVTSRADRDRRYPDMAGIEVAQEAWANMPLVVGGRLIGSTAFGYDDPRDFDDDDVALLTTVARHAAIALDRAALLESRRAAAVTLQRALLPEIVQVPGLEVASHYVPAGSGLEVGGDWYDVFTTGTGAVCLSVGDVDASGVRAAAVMGAVRNVVRACASTVAGPETVLEHVDAYVATLADAPQVSACLVVLEPGTGDAADPMADSMEFSMEYSMAYSVAGHPLPLLAHAGSVDELGAAVGPPLGGGRVSRPVARLHVGGPWALLMFSDGLTAGSPDGAAMLRRALHDAALDDGDRPARAALAAAVDAVRAPTGGQADDLAALLVRPARPGGTG